MQHCSGFHFCWALWLQSWCKHRLQALDVQCDFHFSVFEGLFVCFFVGKMLCVSVCWAVGCRFSSLCELYQAVCSAHRVQAPFFRCTTGWTCIGSIQICSIDPSLAVHDRKLGFHWPNKLFNTFLESAFTFVQGWGHPRLHIFWFAYICTLLRAFLLPHLFFWDTPNKATMVRCPWCYCGGVTNWQAANMLVCWNFCWKE